MKQVDRLMSDCVDDGSAFACDFAHQMCTEGSTTVCDYIVFWQRMRLVTTVMTGVGQAMNQASQRSTVIVLPNGYRGTRAAQQVNCANLQERGLASSYDSYSAGCGR
jgi:hypothetical protein